MSTRFYRRQKGSGSFTSMHARNSNDAHQPPPGAAATPTRNSYRPGMYLEDIAGSIDRSDCSSEEDVGNSSHDFDFGLDTSFDDPHHDPVPATPSSTPQSMVNQAEGNNYVVAMLQQQQFMLKNVLDGQKLLEKKQDTMETKLQELESKVNKPNVVTPTTPGSNKKRKKVVTRTLLVRDCSYMLLISFVCTE